MKRWVAIVLLAVIPAAGACGKGPSEDQCKMLLEHLIDLEFKKSGAGTPINDGMKAELAKQKAAAIEVKSAEFMTTCVDRTAKDRVECALAATDLNAVAKCDEVK